MGASFANLVAIVTGGGGSGTTHIPGIGETVCRLLAAEGARVAVADISAEAAASTVGTIERAGGSGFAVVGDLTDEAACRRVVESTIGRFGRIDVLINNLGSTLGAPVTDTGESEWDRAMAVNVKSALFMCKYAIPRMSAGGAVINISTTAIDTPSASAAYGATKSALEGLSKHIAMQYGSLGVRCNIVRPGAVWTAMMERACKSPEEVAARRTDRRARTALGTEGDATDIARAVAFLASPLARWISGQTLTVDGGAGLLRPDPNWFAPRARG